MRSTDIWWNKVIYLSLEKNYADDIIEFNVFIPIWFYVRSGYNGYNFQNEIQINNFVVQIWVGLYYEKLKFNIYTFPRAFFSAEAHIFFKF